MQSDHDPRRVYEKLGELYEEAHRVHVASGNALVEIINALSRKAEADGAFLEAFAHLVPQPLPEAPPPPAHGQGHGFGHVATGAVRGQPLPSAPPPLPEDCGHPVPEMVPRGMRHAMTDEEREDHYERWMEAVGRRPMPRVE